MSTDGGQSFGKPFDYEQAGGSPVLATDGETLFIAWTGAQSALNVASVQCDQSGSPTAIINVTNLNETSNFLPALAVLNGFLFLAWADGNTHQLNMLSSPADLTLFEDKNKLTLPQTSSTAPALCVNNGNLYIAWSARGSNQVNTAAVDVNGVTNGPTGITDISPIGTSELHPALAAFNGYRLDQRRQQSIKLFDLLA